MLGLPQTPALDTRARVERIDDAPPEEVRRDRRRWKKDVPRDRWLGRLRVARNCLAEQQPESWSGGTKLNCRRHREVELKHVRQQEHAVAGRTAPEVGKVYRVELVDE